jgi:hypothetical protein
VRFAEREDDAMGASEFAFHVCFLAGKILDDEGKTEKDGL